MKPVYRALAAATLVALSASSHAATTVYTTSASFLAQVAAGAYTNSFTGLSSPAGLDPAAFSGLGFSYTASSPVGLYLDAGFLGTNQVNASLTLTFTGSVKAIGGNFFNVDIGDAFQASTVTIQLSDGTSTTLTPATIGDSYRGFISTVGITSLTIAAPTGLGAYASLDNLTIGNAVAVVPEPASMLLMGLGVAGLLVARRRAA